MDRPVPRVGPRVDARTGLRRGARGIALDSRPDAGTTFTLDRSILARSRREANASVRIRLGCDRRSSLVQKPLLMLTGILHALRLAAIGLLVLSVLCGPAGLGASLAVFATGACGSKCPCDEATPDQDRAGHLEVAGTEVDHHAGSEHDAGAPSDDGCPEGCPKCSGTPAVAIALSPWALPDSALSSSPVRLPGAADMSARGASLGVFRPPRMPC